jgi:hypothetical protein
MEHERACLVGVPFKRRMSKSIKISDFIFILSLDLKWGPPEKVRALLREAEIDGLVEIEGDMVHATAELEKMEIPIGFKPSVEGDFIDKCIVLISSRTGMSRKEIIAMVNERQDAFQKLVAIDALVLLVAKEMGIDVSDLALEAYNNLLASATKDKCTL